MTKAIKTGADLPVRCELRCGKCTRPCHLTVALRPRTVPAHLTQGMR